MTIYVDNFGFKTTVFNPWTGRHVTAKWYHLVSDQLAWDELHAFAERLGLKREYFQLGMTQDTYNPGHDHYDVTEPKRKRAIQLGARPVDVHELGRIIMTKNKLWHSLVDQRATEMGAKKMVETPEFETLAEAKEWLNTQLQRSGATCPCCGQLAKIYKRKLNSNMARTLIQAYRTVGLGWFHAPTVLGKNDGELAKLRYWGLIEEEQTLRADGGRAGWWRITPHGELYALGEMDVPAHALVYDGELLRLDESSGRLDIRAALGERFSYQELMQQTLPVLEGISV